MIFDRLDHWINLLGRIPRNPAVAREAIERLIAPGLARDVDGLVADRDEVTEMWRMARNAAESHRRQAEEAEQQRDRAQVGWDEQRRAHNRTAGDVMALGQALTAAERQRDDLRAAMAGALRELDALDVSAWAATAATRVTAAKGLLRAMLGDAPTEPAGCIRGTPSRECNCHWCCAHTRGES